MCKSQTTRVSSFAPRFIVCRASLHVSLSSLAPAFTLESSHAPPINGGSCRALLHVAVELSSSATSSVVEPCSYHNVLLSSHAPALCLHIGVELCSTNEWWFVSSSAPRSCRALLQHCASCLSSSAPDTSSVVEPCSNLHNRFINAVSTLCLDTLIYFPTLPPGF